MEKGSGDSDRPSGSKMTSIPSVDEGDINTQLDENIKKFLDEESSKEGSPISKKPRVGSPVSEKVFKQGSSVSDSEINEIIKELGKSISISNLDKDYKEFLNKYGSIYGSGFCICGPTKHDSDKVKYVLLKQSGFEERCKMNKMKDTQVKLCWLIAEDEDNQYYFDLSEKKKGYIYSMNLYGKSKFFAKNFLDFLDNFFSVYESKTDEEDSD